MAQQQYNGWLNARQKYGYTNSHDTKLITDKEEAQRVRHLPLPQGHPLTLTPTTNIRYLASTLSSRSSFDLPVLFIRKCIYSQRLMGDCAGKLTSANSHKLCTSLMQTALDSSHSDFQLFSWTPVDSISPHSSELSGVKEDRWTIKTRKGSIIANRVVLCTNAHTQNFFPKEHPMHSQ